MKIRRHTLNWGYKPACETRTSYTAYVVDKIGNPVWSTNATTKEPAKCDIFSRRAVFAMLRERIKTMKPGHRAGVTRHIHV